MKKKTTSKKKKAKSPQQQRDAAILLLWEGIKPLKRKDIKCTKVHNKCVHVGGNNRKSYAPFIKDTLESNFTSGEIHKMKNIYIETNPKNFDKDCSGTSESLDFGKGVKGSIILIPKRKQGNVEGGEDTLTHETIHALRFSTNRYIKDVNREEKETQLESLSRISYDGFQQATTGYYTFVPKLDTIAERFDAMDSDRILLNNTLQRTRKGKWAIKTVNKKYKKTQLSKAHFSPGENIDRYFLVKLESGTIIRVHKRYKIGKYVNMLQLKDQFKARYGSNAIVWEWQNGKKIKIIGQKSKEVINKMTTYIIMRKGKPVKVGEQPVVIMVATSAKQAIKSFREIHPQVKGRVVATPISKLKKK